ncbi:MAG: efflux RND transporter periplasmic adaptor subunit [Gemmatimonadetes bacterium]|nr:efflux RND transporter periplasmic adaptor subunit [Gemmatimonadota bacterium]
MHSLVHFRLASAAVVAALFSSACGGEPKNAAAGPPTGGASGGTAGAATTPVAGTPVPGGPGGAPAGGARRTASVVLGAADVAKVARGSIEAGIPVAGDLRPIETLSLKARLEGNVEQVYVREGDRVRTGMTLARLEAVDFESALRSAEADVVSARTASSTAQWNFDQSRDLFQAGAIAERDLRATEQAAVAAKAQLAAAEARLRAAQSQVRDTRVTAPVNGTIQFRRVQGGERILRGAELFTLVRSEVLELAAALPARRASEVKPGQAVRFLADGRTFSGRVARVSPTIDPASRSVTAYVQIPNPNGELKGNTFSSGQIIAQVLQNVMVIPQPAVRTGQEGRPFVYRITAGELEQVPVTVGVIDEARGLVEVKEGLQLGDQVVVGNVGTLGRGMKAQIIGTERGPGAERARGGETRESGPGGAGRGGQRRDSTAARKAAPDSAARAKAPRKPTG